MLDVSIRKRFSELKLCGQRCDISAEEKQKYDRQCIEYLLSLLQGEKLTSAEDIGFCYWNLSDNYAFLRDGDALFANHMRFYQYLKGMPAQYLYWAVCDGTQKCMLENSGHADFWWRLYREANKKNRDVAACEAVAFAAHRAALHPNPHKNMDANLLYAKESFAAFLKTAADSASFAFYNIIYQAECLHAFGACEDDLAVLSQAFYPTLALPRKSNEYICGEWIDFVVANEDVCRQARVGICAAVNALIYANQKEKARKIYMIAIENGLPENAYIEKRL